MPAKIFSKDDLPVPFGARKVTNCYSCLFVLDRGGGATIHAELVAARDEKCLTERANCECLHSS